MWAASPKAMNDPASGRDRQGRDSRAGEARGAPKPALRTRPRLRRPVRDEVLRPVPCTCRTAQAQRDARSRTKCVNPRGNCRSPPAVPADIPLLVPRTVDKPSVAQRVFHNIHRAPVAVDKSCRRPARAATVPETTARPRARSSPSPPHGRPQGRAAARPFSFGAIGLRRRTPTSEMAARQIFALLFPNPGRLRPPFLGERADGGVAPVAGQPAVA